MAITGESIMTSERAAAAYDQLLRVELLARDARSRLNSFVDEQGPIAIGGGRMYGRHRRDGRESLAGSVAVQAIREIVGERADAFESLAIERSTSKAAIMRAAKETAQKRGAKKLAEEVIDKIRRLGGSRTGSETFPIGEFTAGPVLVSNDENRDAEIEQLDKMMEIA